MVNSLHPLRSLFRLLFFVVFVFVLGGVAGVMFERIFIPRLAAFPPFQKIGFLKHATDTVTVINKTEQVQIREDDTVERIVSQPATAVVNIIRVGEKTNERTGVLLTNDGLVVTYEDPSAVQKEAKVVILLFDGTSHPAQFFGNDRLTNLTYYRIEGVNTPSIALANSNDAEVGKKLITIGNAAIEYQNRLSVGVLGNKNRIFNLSGKSVASSEKWEGVFEMDVPQAAEFLGGPAINFNGEMEGIVGSETVDNTVHFFLVPSNAVRDSLALVTSGNVSLRPELGVYYLSITKAYAIGNGLSRDRGALIYSPSGKTSLAVLSGSPAEKAGLQYGDIVIAVNGEEINLDHPLSVAIGELKKGNTAELLILRNGTEQKISVVL